MNKVIYVPAGVVQQQVDDFPADCKRERKGALHVRPSSTLVVSEGEWAHLREKHPELASRLQDITPTPPVPAAPKPAAAAVDPAPAAKAAKPTKAAGPGGKQKAAADSSNG